MKKKPRCKCQRSTHYSLLDVMTASPSQPLTTQKQQHHRDLMAASLQEMTTAPAPNIAAWRNLSDAVNMIDTFTACGPWNNCDGDLIDIYDRTGLLDDAMRAMASAVMRLTTSQPMRLDGPGLQAVRTILDSYESLLATMPARTMIACHRKTELRLQDVLKKKVSHPDGVYVNDELVAVPV